MDMERVAAWIDGYERAWRTPGTESLAELFTADATYRRPRPQPHGTEHLETRASGRNDR
jgi:hypothetical protein